MFDFDGLNNHVLINFNSVQIRPRLCFINIKQSINIF